MENFVREYSQQDIPEVANALWSLFKTHTIWLFEGNLGSGKTSLVQALCKEAQIQDTVLSPTFAIVNEYITADQKAFFHMDLYRIHHLEELYEIGIEEYLQADAYCFIEWPELVLPICPKPYVFLKISYVDANKRSIFVSIVF